MKTGLVLEGGGCRGVFTSGVLDEMMERGRTFDYCVGVSAGAGNAMHFKSHQIGRAQDMTIGRDDYSYYGLGTMKKTGHLLDLDLLYHTMSYDPKNPFDFSAYYSNPMVCEYVVTCCETGQAEYLREDVYQKRMLNIVKASCSLPGFTSPVPIDGKHYMDGGIADALPVFRAMSQGCDKIVLVTTKPPECIHPTDYSRMRVLFGKLYRSRYPAFYEALMTRVKRYFAQLDEVLQLEKEGQILIIRPVTCHIKSMETDREKMREYYRHGREIMQEKWDDMQSYLGE